MTFVPASSALPDSPDATDIELMHDERRPIPEDIVDDAVEAFESELIERATKKKRLAAEALSRAFEELCLAQNEITYVEGQGSADIYEEIADAYQTVSKLRGKLEAMKPTGFFE